MGNDSKSFFPKGSNEHTGESPEAGRELTWVSVEVIRHIHSILGGQMLLPDTGAQMLGKRR